MPQSDLIGDNSVDSVAINITLELLGSLLLGTYKLPSKAKTIESLKIVQAPESLCKCKSDCAQSEITRREWYNGRNENS